MQIIAMILSGLALLAAGVSLILIIREKKRNEERSAAFDRYKNTMLQYVDKKFESLQADMKKYTDESITRKVDPVLKKVESIGDDLMNANTSFQDQLGQTLSNIMAFDPMESQRKARMRAMGMGDDD